jgi:uncharacterized protein YggE
MIAAPVSAAGIELEVSGPVIELTINKSVNSTPDLVNLSASVNALAPTAAEALRENAERMERVIAAAEAQGVAAKDLRTSDIDLNPRYRYDNARRTQVFTGYEVSSTVVVRLRDLTNTGRVLDALVTAGADEIDSIRWTVEDPSEAQAEARVAAFDTALERARGFAHQAGYSDVRLLEVSEYSSGWGRAEPLQSEAALGVMNSTMPIRPGEVQTGVTIHVKYEMTR